MRILTGQSVTDDWRRFWGSNQTYMTAFLLALAVDTLSTIHFVSITGPEQEFHPLVRLAVYSYGPIAGPILAAFYKAVGAMIVVLYCPKLAAPLLTATAIVYLLAGFYNYFAEDLFLKGLMPWLPI